MIVKIYWLTIIALFAIAAWPTDATQTALIVHASGQFEATAMPLPNGYQSVTIRAIEPLSENQYALVNFPNGYPLQDDGTPHQAHPPLYVGGDADVIMLHVRSTDGEPLRVEVVTLAVGEEKQITRMVLR